MRRSAPSAPSPQDRRTPLRIRVGSHVAHKAGVTPSILGALRFLEQPQPMGRVAELLHCDPSNVTGIVDTLEERNLAKRKPSAADRRVKVVELTAACKKLRPRASEEMYKPPAWIEELSAADQRKLREVLRRAGDELQLR